MCVCVCAFVRTCVCVCMCVGERVLVGVCVCGERMRACVSVCERVRVGACARGGGSVRACLRARDCKKIHCFILLFTI